MPETLQVRKRISFEHLAKHFTKHIFYQDRLGTNVGKPQNKSRFLQPPPPPLREALLNLFPCCGKSGSRQYTQLDTAADDDEASDAGGESRAAQTGDGNDDDDDDSATEDEKEGLRGKNTDHFILKTIILPRPARDKHRENSKMGPALSQHRLGRVVEAAKEEEGASLPFHQQQLRSRWLRDRRAWGGWAAGCCCSARSFW